MDEKLAAQVDKIFREAKVEELLDQEVWDIPVGQALIGGFIAVLAFELYDAIKDLIPLDEWAKKVAEEINGEV